MPPPFAKLPLFRDTVWQLYVLMYRTHVLLQALSQRLDCLRDFSRQHLATTGVIHGRAHDGVCSLHVRGRNMPAARIELRIQVSVQGD
eukprot:SAG25_NODE_11069_length_314_cov_0.953488_1_plen_87_part_01